MCIVRCESESEEKWVTPTVGSVRPETPKRRLSCTGPEQVSYLVRAEQETFIQGGCNRQYSVHMLREVGWKGTVLRGRGSSTLLLPGTEQRRGGGGNGLNLQAHVAIGTLRPHFEAGDRAQTLSGGAGAFILRAGFGLLSGARTPQITAVGSR